MSKYLFIESKDPFESSDTIQTYGLIKELHSQGHELALFLVQNGVFCSRKNARESLFSQLLVQEKISVFADDFALEERGIEEGEIFSQIKVAPMETLVDLLMEDGRKAIWH
ncbi:MAG: DsrE family protein [Oligoflexales bacterium]